MHEQLVILMQNATLYPKLTAKAELDLSVGPGVAISLDPCLDLIMFSRHAVQNSAHFYYQCPLQHLRFEELIFNMEEN